MVFKKVKIFCVVLFFGSEILSKNSATLWFFFGKKLRYLKSKISTKFHCLLFFFLVFQHFWHFFSISPIHTCLKITGFFVVFYWKGKRFYQQFLENSKSSFKKTLICEIFFFKFCGLLFIFLFFIIFDILFSISSICTCQKVQEIFIFLFYFVD